MSKLALALSLVFVLVCFVPKFIEAQQTNNQLSIRSPRLVALEKQLRSGDVVALDSFWREVRRNGTPLVDQIPGDDKHLLVTFLWRGDKETRNVVVFSAFTTGHPCCTGHTADQLAAGEMAHLAGTDVWFKTIRVPYAARFTYYLSPNDSLVPDPGRTEKDWATQQPDPLNPHRFSLPHDHVYVASLVELPGAPPFPWFDERPDVPKGRLEERSLPTKILAGERHLWVYTPVGYAAQRGPYDLVIFAGDGTYVRMLHGQTILDNLIAAHKIRPVVAVMIDPEDQVRDLGCNEHFNDFLVRELIPWVRERYPVRSEPSAITIGGEGLGGEAAAFAALRHPDVFGNVLAQSAAFAWDPQAPCGWAGCESVPKVNDEEDLQYEWLIRQFAASPKLPIHFSLTVGRFAWRHIYPHMPTTIEASRHMRDVLMAKGYDVTYKELPAGDELYGEAVALPDALSALLQ